MIDGSVDVTPTEREYWKPFVWLAFAVASVVLPLAPTFLSMADVWNRDSTFTHGYVIPLLSAWLLWRDRAALSRVEIKPELRALTVVVALLAVWGAADLAGVQVVRQGAAVALIVASAWVVLGSAFVRAAMFPLAYLFFAVPFGDFLVPYLVEFTTHFTVAAVEAVGVPIYREGTFFSLPSGNFEVVKACSGVRYLIATVALGTLFCALSYSSWRRRVAFMALCLVLPIIANGLRAFGIVMIAHYSGLRYAVGIDHFIYGWVFFGLVIGLLFWIGAKFADRPDAPQIAEHTGSTQRYSVPVLAGVVGVTVFVAGANYFWRVSAAEFPRIDPPQFAAVDSSWRGPLDKNPGWQPEFARSELASGARYESSRGNVTLHARHFPRSNTERDAFVAALVLENEQSTSEGARLFSEESFAGANGILVTAAVVVEASGLRWRVWRLQFIDGVPVRSALSGKMLALRAWLRHRRPTTTVVSAMTPLAAKAEGVQAADDLLGEFLKAHASRVLVDAK